MLITETCLTLVTNNSVVWCEIDYCRPCCTSKEQNKKPQYHTVETVLKSNCNIAETRRN